MILFIVLAILTAKIKGCIVRGIFKEYSLIPVLIMEVLFWYFQICAWMGEYRYIQYAAQIQMFYILALLFPILKFKLYNKAIAGSIMVALGSVMNRVVMNANGGRMPVFPTVSRFTGYFKTGALEAAEDVRHILMSSETPLKYLGDYIDVGFSIMSPGDILMHGFVTLVIYGVVKELNRKGLG